MIPRYSRPELAALWDDRYRFELWLEIELAVCEAMEDSLVPKGTARTIREKASGKLDAARILEIEQTTRHDVIAFLTHVEELAGEPARWLHLGMTSSDVLDTALALQTGRALDKIITGVMGLASALADKAREHAKTPTIGRSHGIHAEPITAGLVFARWQAEVVRASSRLIRARHAIAVGKIAGAVGVYGNLDPAIEEAALTRLGLEPETVATQIVARDRHAEVLSAIALLGTAIEQIALGVRHWQRTEVGEAEEGFGAGQKGSSAMPHKKNPILSENLCGLARLLRSYAQAGFEDVALWHERDISHSSVERIAMPDATILADFMTARDDARQGARRPREPHAREPRSDRRAVFLRGRPARARQDRTAAPEGVRDGPALCARRDQRRRGRGNLRREARTIPCIARGRSGYRVTARRQGARCLLRSRASPASRAVHPRSSTGSGEMIVGVDVGVGVGESASASARPALAHLDASERSADRPRQSASASASARPAIAYTGGHAYAAADRNADRPGPRPRPRPRPEVS